jgi:D-alanyl-D-alanine carboxypeptidase
LPNSWHKISLRQLLNHGSGLSNFTEDPDYVVASSASPKNAPQPRELLSYVEDEPLNFKAGTSTPTRTTSQCRMVEPATGESYERQLREQVYGPLDPL